MSNVLYKITDDYEDYKEVCTILGFKPLHIIDGFHNHMKVILNEYGVNTYEEFHKKYKSTRASSDRGLS